MKKVRCVHTVRGFWNDLFSQHFENFYFENCDNNMTEILSDRNKGIAKIIRKVVCCRLFDYFGVYQTLHIKDEDVDILLSYNRFLKTKKPYILMLETPLSLVHYCIKRPCYLISKIRLKKTFSDPNLRAIVCISKAAFNTLNNYYDIPSSIKQYMIYPAICADMSQEEIYSRRVSDTKTCVNCLFVASQFYLKGGSELIESIKRNNWDKRKDVKYTIITNLATLDQATLTELNNMKNVCVFDYKFSRKDLYDMYLSADILINMTRWDSFSLVTMEAIKFGCAVISTKMYAIKEMVIDGYNGYLTEPTCKMFLDNDMKNNISKKERTHLYEAFVDERIVKFESEKINYLLNNKQALKELQLNSLKLYNDNFSEDKICSQWENVIECIE